MSIEPKRLVPDYMPGNMEPPPVPQMPRETAGSRFEERLARWRKSSIPELILEGRQPHVQMNTWLAAALARHLDQRIREANREYA